MNMQSPITSTGINLQALSDNMAYTDSGQAAQGMLTALQEGNAANFNAYRENLIKALPTDLGIKNPEIIDIKLPENMSLNGKDLTGINLERVDLANANLAGTNLSGANLHNTNLSGATLTNANLSGADLNGTNMNGAHAQGANLSGAHGMGTKLEGANLSGATVDETTKLKGAIANDSTQLNIKPAEGSSDVHLLQSKGNQAERVDIHVGDKVPKGSILSKLTGVVGKLALGGVAAGVAVGQGGGAAQAATAFAEEVAPVATDIAQGEYSSALDTALHLSGVGILAQHVGVELGILEGESTINQIAGAAAHVTAQAILRPIDTLNSLPSSIAGHFSGFTGSGSSLEEIPLESLVAEQVNVTGTASAHLYEKLPTDPAAIAALEGKNSDFGALANMNLQIAHLETQLKPENMPSDGTAPELQANLEDLKGQYTDLYEVLAEREGGEPQIMAALEAAMTPAAVSSPQLAAVQPRQEHIVTAPPPGMGA